MLNVLKAREISKRSQAHHKLPSAVADKKRALHPGVLFHSVGHFLQEADNFTHLLLTANRSRSLHGAQKKEESKNKGTVVCVHLNTRTYTSIYIYVYIYVYVYTCIHV